MKPLTSLLVVFLSFASRASECNDLNAVNLLLGQWLSKSDKVVISEHWQAVDNHYLKGSSTTKSLAKADKPPFVEAMTIVKMSGEIFYLAKPPQNPMPTPFKLVACNNARLRFENQAHDFPKVIEYIRHGEKGLTAEVTDGKNKGFKIEYEKL